MQTTDVFPLVPRRRLVWLSVGGMHSARRGSGSDVAGSRPYQPGDDVRAIDWAASARLSSARAADEFVVREHYADEAPRVVVLCDYRPSMAFFPPELPWLSKPVALRHAAELVVESAIAARGFLGYLDVAERTPAWRPPRTQRVPPELAATRPFTALPDGLPLAFKQLRQHRQA